MSVNNETIEMNIPCEPPCEKRPMIGRSWWKQFGYNTACGCAYKAYENYEKKEAEWKKSCIEKNEKKIDRKLI
jgi:hypothetical protein